MSQTLEQRVEELEKKVVELNGRLDEMKKPKKDWTKSIGIFADDPVYDSAMRLGREWREAQTYEKEIAGS